jgi:hypothetical protein
MKLQDLSIEVKAAEEGEWHDHPYLDGIEVLVRSAESDAYQQALSAEIAKIPRRLTEKERNKATRDAINAAVSVLVLDWRGIDDAPYSAATAKQWAVTREVSDGYRIDPQFFAGIQELANDIGRADKAGLEEAAGNSQRRSSTGSQAAGSTTAKKPKST